MSFFQNMNLARGIMLGALATSAVLAFVGWKQHGELQELRADRDRNFPTLVPQLMSSGRKHTQLAKNLDKEGLKGQTNLMSYAVSAASAANVEIGNIDPTASKDTNVGVKGIVDQKLSIKPQDPKRSYPRTRIANYLYTLESESRRVKVTDLEISLANPKVQRQEVPEDGWTFQAEITSRQRVD
jgi:hypothetical protein